MHGTVLTQYLLDLQLSNPMLVKRPADTRGRLVRPFIDTRRTFSFPSYYDARYMNYSHLQTINDDRVQYRWQVPWHEHRNMEIFGYVVQGSSHHVDSLGNDVEVPAGAVQRMSSGSGISHTEGNTADQPNRYLQLWIQPNVLDTEPTHAWHQFSREDKLNQFCDITEKLPIKQDARFLAGIFTQQYSMPITPSRRYYLYMVTGTATVNGIAVAEGDGLSFEQEYCITVADPADCEIILFDLI
jgi:redox-sensitive bicupin YhaK (pirin superfamily)